MEGAQKGGTEPAQVRGGTTSGRGRRGARWPCRRPRWPCRSQSSVLTNNLWPWRSSATAPDRIRAGPGGPGPKRLPAHERHRAGCVVRQQRRVRQLPVVAIWPRRSGLLAASVPTPVDAGARSAASAKLTRDQIQTVHQATISSDARRPVLVSAFHLESPPWDNTCCHLAEPVPRSGGRLVALDLSYPDTSFFFFLLFSFLTSVRRYGRLSAVLDRERNQNGGFRDSHTRRGWGQSGSNGRLCYLGAGHHTRTEGSTGCFHHCRCRRRRRRH